MPTAPSPKPIPAATGQGDEQQALLGALQLVLAPLARLVLARGLPYGTLEELLKQALVDEADRAHADMLPHRRVSRVSTATGIHRREVTRLIQLLREGRMGQTPQRRSLPHELVAHWMTNPRFLTRRGDPRVLPRQGGADDGPSFEELAHQVTRDVHPRSLLEELVRLGMVQVSDDGATLRLRHDAILPRGDQARALRVLGTNVGAHLQAAVDNVQAPDAAPHLERALFADGLTDDSVAEVRTLVELQWQALVQALVPAVEARVARDQGQPGANRHMRLGLYHHAAGPAPGTAAAEPPAPSPNEDVPAPGKAVRRNRKTRS